MDKLVTLISVIGSVILLAICAKYFTRHTFVCDKCDGKFKPKFYQFFTTHMNDTYIMRCPHCHTKGKCTMWTHYDK